MTTGRKLRLGVAAILAALFAFVLVAHTDLHGAGSSAPEPPCAMCSTGEIAAADAPAAPHFATARVLGCTNDVRLTHEALIQHAPRGPPHAG